MPRYDYKCPRGHTTTVFRTFRDRTKDEPCAKCGKPGLYQFPLTHRLPDGMYSYAPNLGDPHVFEKRHEHMREGNYARKHGEKGIQPRKRTSDER